MNGHVQAEVRIAAMVTDAQVKQRVKCVTEKRTSKAQVQLLLAGLCVATRHAGSARPGESGQPNGAGYKQMKIRGCMKA